MNKFSAKVIKFLTIWDVRQSRSGVYYVTDTRGQKHYYAEKGAIVSIIAFLLLLIGVSAICAAGDSVILSDWEWAIRTGLMIGGIICLWMVWRLMSMFTPCHGWDKED